jgi:hypothetical protein
VGVYSTFVDIYNATSQIWSGYPDGLGQARSDMAVASLPPNLVIFAGGEVSGTMKRVFALQLHQLQSDFVAN